MRKVIKLYANDATTLTEKVNKVFILAEKEGSTIIATHFVWALYDNYYAFIEYEYKQGAK